MKNNFCGKYGPLLIAEIGGNHEGNYDYALELTNLAINSGVDVVKFQIYTGDSLVSEIESPTRNVHFKKFELSLEQHMTLARKVIDAGLIYMASVWDMHLYSQMQDFIPIIKVGSGDLTALPLLKFFASTGKPIILSTGLSTMNEVKESVDFIQNCNSLYHDKNYLALLQCTSMYPIKDTDANLAVLDSFSNFFNLTVGYSDHTVGSEALIYSYIRGAQILEFHFTDNKENRDFRDHQVSLEISDVKSLISNIIRVNKFLGNSLKEPIPIELENNHHISFRRACYPKRDIKQGERFTIDNLTILRPNSGIDARYYFDILGKVCCRDIKRHESLSWTDIK